MTLLSQKTVGIVGGIGPESTVDYYRLLVGAGHMRIIINSVAVQDLLGMMMKGDTTGVADYLTAAVEQLAVARADVALIAANTPHVAFDEVQRRSRIPLVSIVEATAEHVQAHGMTAGRAARHPLHDAGPFLSRRLRTARPGSSRPLPRTSTTSTRSTLGSF